jgi:hypothetical protein
MAEIGNLLNDVKELQRRLGVLEHVVRQLVQIVDARGSTDVLTRIMEDLGLWPTKQRRTRARR